MPRRKEAKIKKSRKKTVRKTKQQIEADLLLQERTEKDKRLIMWSGVTFFMALILVIWIFNLKTVFKTNDVKQESGFEWKETTEELSQTINDFKESWNEIKTEKTSDESTATSSDELTKDEITELKLKIEELETKLNNQEDNK